jgi:hypothetical protein
MPFKRTDFRQLAARIRTGDAAAVTEFLDKLEPQLMLIIRRVIRTGAAHSAIGQRIMAEFEQLLAAGAIATEGDRLIREIASRICWTTVVGLRSGRAEGRGVFDTVVGN